MFGMPFAITAGGPQLGADKPGATEYVMVYAYRQIYQVSNYGRATAFAVLIFIMLFLAALYGLRITKITSALMSRKPSVWMRILQYAVLIGFAIFAFYPVWFAILASGRLGDRLYTLNLAGMFFPTEWTFENYRVMLFERPFLTWLTNSLKVAVAATIFSLIISTSAAFALSRFRFRGREAFLILLLALSTFPGLLSLVAIAQHSQRWACTANIWV